MIKNPAWDEYQSRFTTRIKGFFFLQHMSIRKAKTAILTSVLMFKCDISGLISFLFAFYFDCSALGRPLLMIEGKLEVEELSELGFAASCSKHSEEWNVVVVIYLWSCLALVEKCDSSVRTQIWINPLTVARGAQDFIKCFWELIKQHIDHLQPLFSQHTTFNLILPTQSEQYLDPLTQTSRCFQLQ